MTTIQDQFEAFYQNIKLTSLQIEDAKKKYDGVCKKLHDHYFPDIEYSGQTRLLIGSYGKHTHIRPARDVDVIFIMPDEKFNQYDDNQSNGQSQLLQDIKKILEEKYSDTPIKADVKVVKLEFSDPTHNIELLPAWELENSTFKTPNSKNSGSWEIDDPRSEIDEIRKSDEKTGQTKKLIRMIKKWSEQCSVKVKSYEIEKMVLSFFASHGKYEKCSGLVKDFFDFYLNGITDENLKSYLNTALSRAKKACEFEEAEKLEEAIDEWKKVFGDDFPKNGIDKNEMNSVSKPIINPPKPWLSN